MSDSLSNLSTGVAMAEAREFLREMAQPVTRSTNAACMLYTCDQYRVYTVPRASSARVIMIEGEPPA
jgi:hypothetical protein